MSEAVAVEVELVGGLERLWAVELVWLQKESMMLLL